MPDWHQPVGAIVLLLLRSPLPLQQPCRQVELAKAHLRRRALVVGAAVEAALQQRGYQTALFDPMTGLPTDTSFGIPLDDVAVAQQLLGYPAQASGPCTCLIHPTWGSAVYPATLLST